MSGPSPQQMDTSEEARPQVPLPPHIPATAPLLQYQKFFPTEPTAIGTPAAAPAMGRHSAPAATNAQPAVTRELQVVWQGHWKSASSRAAEQKADDQMELDSDDRDEDDPRMVSRELKISAASMKQLIELIHLHFPTDPSRPILLTDEDQKELTVGSFSRLHNADVVLVFEADRVQETRITFQWSKSFQHIPHPSVVTYSQELIAEEGRGASHAIVYALAEFIDNSISALRKYRVQHPHDTHYQGHIRILLLEHLNQPSCRFTIAIEDDGCGMTRESLEAFSRMGDAPQYRNEAREAVEPDADNHYLNINISQWGIGAKSAGFFIGDNIIVSTRSSNLNQVLETSMSQKRMFSEHKKTGNAYKDEMSRRAIGDAKAHANRAHMHPFMEHCIAQEERQRHFTRICITGIEERHQSKLEDLHSIVLELANVYNRFLHGPLGRETESISNATKTWLRPTITVERVVEYHPSPEEADQAHWRVKDYIDLGEVTENDASQFQLLKQGPVFRFELQIKAPSTDSHSVEAAQGRSSEAHVRGEIYYLPRSVDGETHPELKRMMQKQREANEAAEQTSRNRSRAPGADARRQLLHPTAAAAAAHAAHASHAASLAAGTLVQPPVDDDGNLIMEDAQSTSTFDLYWHGRLIPLSHVNLLSFMKLRPDEKDLLPRMKGYLFFSFPFVTSRNKLTFSERNLQEYLNDKSNWLNDRNNTVAVNRDIKHNAFPLDDLGILVPRPTFQWRIENKWKDTLAKWKALDAMYEWLHKDRLAAESAKQGKELYRQVHIHGSANKEFKTLKAGEVYKIVTGKTTKPEWLRAMWFEKENVASQAAAERAASEYGGTGKVLGEVMPLEAQLGLSVRSLGMIDKKTPLSKQREEYQQHRSLLMSHQPAQIRVWMVPRTELVDKSKFRKTAGWALPGTAIAVLGHEHLGARKIISGTEKVECVIEQFTQDFDPEPPQGSQADMEDVATGAPAARSTKVQRSSRGRVRSSKKRGGAQESDDEPLAPAKRARKKSRRSGEAGKGSSAMIDVSDSSAVSSAAEESSPSSEDERDGVKLVFRDIAPCMQRDSAEMVIQGGAIPPDRNANDASAAAAAAASASSAVSGKKRKGGAGVAELGRNGFCEFKFGKNCGRYTVTFSLPDWTVDGLTVHRKAVQPVSCELLIGPALPVEINRALIKGRAPVPDLRLGQPDTEEKIGFHLVDSFENVWNWASLRGDMSRCGIQIATITTDVAGVSATAQPVLVWSTQYRHWALKDLRLTYPDVPEGQQSPLGLTKATDRVDVTVSLTFDVRQKDVEGQPRYIFDPPPGPDAIRRLHQVTATVKVKLGPGPATDFICEEVPDVFDVENGGAIEHLSMHLADQWHHCTWGTSDMQICTAAQLHFLPSTFFTADHDVLTPDGWKLLPHVEVGDQVWSMHDPAAGDTRQGWCAVTEVLHQPPPDQLWLFLNSNYSLLTTSHHSIDGEQANPMPKGSQALVYNLMTERTNFFVRRHDNRIRWRGIFTGAHPASTIPFALPALPTRKFYQVNQLGQVLFERVSVDLPASFFAAHCVEQVPGEPLVEFNYHISLQFADQPELHPVKTMRVIVKPRWGPVQALLLKGKPPKAKARERLPASLLEPLTLDGVAGEEISNLHIAFLHESGRLISVKELQEGLAYRCQQLRFWLDGLDGASTQFSLADLNADGHIDSGLSFPAILGATSKSAASEDGAVRTYAGALRMEVDESIPVEEPRAPEERKHREDEDVEMADGAAGAGDKKPSLSALIPHPKLSTAFSMRVSPGLPSRWSLTAAFPRGFKCGLVWNDHLQVSLTDRFGNRTAMPKMEHEPKLEVLVYAAVPVEAPAVAQPAPPSPTHVAATPSTPPAAQPEATPMEVDSSQPAESSQQQMALQAGSASYDTDVYGGSSLETHLPMTPAMTIPPTQEPASTQPAAAASDSAPPVATAAAAPVDLPVDPSTTPIVNVVKNWHPKRPALADGSLAPYYTSTSAFLVLKAGTYWLVARDATGQFAPSAPTQVQIVAGTPHHIRAFTSADCTPETEVGYEAGPDITKASASRRIQVASKGRVGRIWCKFYDRGENETTSAQTVKLQLVLPEPKEKPATPMVEQTPAAMEEGTAPTPVAKVEELDASQQQQEEQAEDQTISGIYAYPLATTKPSHQSIFAAASEASSAAAAASTVKPEVAPLSDLTGAKKDADLTSHPYVLLEEFTLHLNERDWTGSVLLIQAYETKPLKAALGSTAAAAATSAASSKKKPNKSIKHDICILLDVKPFESAVQSIRLQPEYDPERMQATLATANGELTLQAPLLKAPTVRARPRAPSSGPSSTYEFEASHPVPAGTPFPIVRVSAIFPPKKRIAPEAPAASGPDGAAAGGPPAGTPDAVVKLEPGTQGAASALSISGHFMVGGFDVDVYYLPDGVARMHSRVSVKNLYRPPRFDEERGQFVFEPMRDDGLHESPGSAAAASPSTQRSVSVGQDYVFNQTGDWLFFVRYVERRSHVRDVMIPAECQRFAWFVQSVVPGQPKSLVLEPAPSDDIVVGNIDRAQATLAPGFQPRGSRTIASRLTLQLHDAFGQVVPFATLTPESIAVLRAVDWRLTGIAERAIPASQPPPPTVQVATNGRDAIIIIDSDEDEEMPGAASLGAPAAPAPVAPPQLTVSPLEVDFASSSLVFREVAVVPNSTGDSGKYHLQFQAPYPYDHLRAAFHLYFSNDLESFEKQKVVLAQRNTAIAAVRARYSAKLSELIAAQEAQRTLEREYRSLQDRQQVLQDRMHHVLTDLEKVGVIAPSHSLSSVVALQTNLLEQRHALEQQQSSEKSNSIPAKVPPPRPDWSPFPRLTRADGYHGRIAEVASISDAKLCALISWQLQSYITCFITSDRSCQADRAIRDWCRTNRHGQVLDLAGINPQHSFDPAKLPHHFITHEAARAYVPRGHPRYVVQCFDYGTSDKRERQLYFALLHSILNRTLVLDSMDDAVAYRAHLIQYHQQCPTILVLKELKALASNNIERYDSGAYARGLNNLNAHFAIRPAAASGSGAPVYSLEEQSSELARALAVVSTLTPESDELDRTSAKLNHSRSARALEEKVHQAKKGLHAVARELEQLGVSPESVENDRRGGSASTAASASASRPALITAPTPAQQAYAYEQERRRAAQAQALQEQERAAQMQRAQTAPAAAPAADSSSASSTSVRRGSTAIRGGRRY